jgi:excisionase family DNA binding protein
MERETDERTPEREFMTVAELQEWLGIGKTMLFSVLLSGEMRSFKIGRRRLIRRSDAEVWLEKKRYYPGQ